MNHDFHLKSDMLTLPNIYKKFRKMYLKIYQVDPLIFLSASGLHDKQL